MKLRSPHQTGSLEALRTKHRHNKRLLLVLPTGTGKTVIFANIQNAMQFSRKMLVLVHRDELATQAKDKIEHWNPLKKVGIEMGSSYADHNCDVIVASVQTLGRVGSKRIQRFDPSEFDCIVVDEAHHAVASSYRLIFRHFGVDTQESKYGVLLIGVTATPDRGDGIAMNEVFDEIAYSYPLMQALRDGWLVTPRGLMVKNQSKLDSVQTRAGDFAQDQLSKEVNTYENNRLCVAGWKEQGEQRQTVAFCVDIQHAKDLARAFNNAGIPAEAVWGDDPDRANKLFRHRNKEFKVLCNCQVLTEGYDDPNIGHIIINCPTKSRGKYMQMMGRGLRLEEGIGNIKEAAAKGIKVNKTDCIVQDMVGASTRHSIITLATLAGMSQKVDMKGKTLLEVQDAIDEMKESQVKIDLSKVESIDKMNVALEDVDLMAQANVPETIQFSEYQWRRAKDAYVLLLTNGDDVVVHYEPSTDDWRITGKIRSNKITDKGRTLELAIQSADDIVRNMGGKGLLTKIRKPGVAAAPTLAKKISVMCARQLGIRVEIGATEEEVQKLIDEKKQRMGLKRA